MDTKPEFEKLDPLGLTNTITLSALVAILVRKGLMTEGELTLEIRQLRAKLERDKRPTSSDES